jgi:LacI family gluconate utilization system Gnt-I transcriptional repressor
MQEVAARAGVSPMTVSRALRNPGAVSKTMLDRVQAAIRETGYVPNRLAGSLSSQRSDIVGLVVPGISNSLYASTAQAISDVLRARDLHLTIASCGHSKEEEENAIAAFMAQRVCGLILHGSRHTERAAAMIEAGQLPTVEIGQLTRQPLDMCISYSGRKAAQAMTARLGALGYRRIAFVSLPVRGNERAAERRRGFHAAMEELGLPVPPSFVLEAEHGFEGGARAVAILMEGEERPEAIFFAADVMAVGALFECQRRGWTVPDDVAIASFDDLDLLRHVVPTITTLRIPREEIARRAALALLDRLDGRQPSSRVVDLGFEIVERESTRSPPSTAALREGPVTSPPRKTAPARQSSSKAGKRVRNARTRT